MYHYLILADLITIKHLRRSSYIVGKGCLSCFLFDSIAISGFKFDWSWNLLWAYNITPIEDVYERQSTYKRQPVAYIGSEPQDISKKRR